jgi:hypothetical protein
VPAKTLDEPFLRHSFLRNTQRLGSGMDRHVIGQPFDRGDIDILEFIGHHIARGGKVLEHDAVVIVRARQAGGGLRSNTLAVGGEDVGAVTELRGGTRQHPPELSAAENADRGARW